MTCEIRTKIWVDTLPVPDQNLYEQENTNDHNYNIDIPEVHVPIVNDRLELRGETLNENNNSNNRKIKMGVENVAYQYDSHEQNGNAKNKTVGNGDVKMFTDPRLPLSIPNEWSFSKFLPDNSTPNGFISAANFAPFK
ncbi:unnamed protein product, partial [Owenia fusiformis]